MKNIKTFMKEKGFLVLTLAAVVAITGIAALSTTNDKTENQNNLYVDLEETTSIQKQKEKESQFLEEPAQPDQNSEFVEAETTFPGDAAFVDSEETSVNYDTNLMDATDEPTMQIAEAEDDGKEDTEQVAGPALNLAFTEESKLSWPVEGNVIMDFSMDASVYFPTLDQYKYNPAIVIQSQVNTPVLAATGGIVTEVSSNEEIGEYIIMEIGNEYQIQYGQLKAIDVSEGDTIEKGDLIGYISEPTKYYVVEGSNLYFMLTKEGEPVDPLDYME